MIPLLGRCALEWKDRLRFQPLLHDLLAHKELWFSRPPKSEDPHVLARAITRLCGLARRSSNPRFQERLETRIREHLARLDPTKIDWREFDADIDNPLVHKAALIKPWISPREKGVVFFSFESQWLKLLKHVPLAEFARHYDIVVAPTWSPPHHLFAFAFPKAYPGPVFSLISNTKDLEYFPRFAPNYVMVPLFASSWVNSDCFQPLPPEQKDIDVLMVANFGTFKRHHVLFKALRQMSAQYRVVLIGQEQDGRTAATIRAEARCYGVDNRLDIRANVPYGEVAATLPRAKVSVIMSRREGSCVVVAESLFAGTPVGILESAEIGSKQFINPQTGRLLRESRLADDLTEFLAQFDRFQPRQWAEQNISCTRSSAVLNDILKKYALEHGQDWTQDIAPMCWRPDPRLMRSEDRERLEPARKDLETRFRLKLL